MLTQRTTADKLTICYCKNQIDISFLCVCPVIDNEFHHNIVKDVCGAVIAVESALKYSFVLKGIQTKRKGNYNAESTLSPRLSVKPLITATTAILTILWQNSWSVTGQTHEKLTSTPLHSTLFPWLFSFPVRHGDEVGPLDCCLQTIYNLDNLLKTYLIFLFHTVSC